MSGKPRGSGGPGGGDHPGAGSSGDGAGGCFPTAVVRRGVHWLSGLGPDGDVVVSSRVRLARNLAGFPFLNRATRTQRQGVLDRTRERLLALAAGESPAGAGAGSAAPSKRLCQQLLWVDVHRAPTLDRTLMVERHLISKEHARGPTPFGGPGASVTASGTEDKSGGGMLIVGGGALAGAGNGGEDEPAREGKPTGAAGAGAGVTGEPRGVAISLPDESLSVMVNEEDHLRLQALVSGLGLLSAFAALSRVDDAIEGPTSAGEVEYAYSARFGYLTACPTNVGTGLRASVMLHLPGLKLLGEMDKVRRATRDMSLAVRGYYGEGSEAAGEFFQISNQTTLGKTETAVIEELEREIIPQVVAYERAARRVLLDKRRRLLEDKVFRALGTLRHARLLTPEEAIMLLSDVRLGVLVGLIQDVTHQQVNQLVLLTQPAHLQRALGREMDQGERREARADFVRQALGA